MGNEILTDYYSTIETEIMHEGTFNRWDMTPVWMQEIVDSYDIQVLKAPLVIDHVERGPAFGHVLSLKLVDIADDKSDMKIIAVVGLTAEGHYLVHSGAYPERSLYLRMDYPFDGIWYLCHLSLLGAANPAVTRMGPVVTHEDLEEFKAELEDVFQKDYALMFSAKFLWEKNEGYFQRQIRPLSKFKTNTFKTETLKGKSGILTISGKLKSKYVSDKASANQMVIHAILFDITFWDLAKAKKWFESSEKKLSTNPNDGGLKMSQTEDGQNLTSEEELQLQAEVKDSEIKELKLKAQEADKKLVLAEQAKIAAEAKLDSADIKGTIDTMLAAGQLLPVHVEMGIEELVVSIPADLVIGDKSARNLILECVSASVGKELQKEITKPKPSVKKPLGKDKDLDTLEASNTNVMDGSIEVAKLARKKIADGIPAMEAYSLAVAELSNEEGGTD